MTEPAFRWCNACHRPRSLVELLRVTPTNGAAEWYCCRPSVSNGVCFSSVVPTRLVALIALAEPIQLTPNPARVRDLTMEEAIR